MLLGAGDIVEPALPPDSSELYLVDEASDVFSLGWPSSRAFREARQFLVNGGLPTSPPAVVLMALPFGNPIQSPST